MTYPTHISRRTTSIAFAGPLCTQKWCWTQAAEHFWQTEAWCWEVEAVHRYAIGRVSWSQFRDIIQSFPKSDVIFFSILRLYQIASSIEPLDLIHLSRLKGILYHIYVTVRQIRLDTSSWECFRARLPTRHGRTTICQSYLRTTVLGNILFESLTSSLMMHRVR